MLKFLILQENENFELKLLKNSIDEMIIEKRTISNSNLRKHDKYKYWEYYLTEVTEGENYSEKRSTEFIKISRVDGKNVISEEMCEDLFFIIENMLLNSGDDSLSNIIKKCENLFEKQKRIIKEEKLVGYLGELAFLDELIKHYPEAIMWWHRKDNMQFDFYIKELSEYLEIKSNSSLKDEYLIKLDQIKDKNPYIGGINFRQDDNGESIYYFLDKFKDAENESLKEFVEELLSLIKDFPKILDYKINLKDLKIKIFHKEDFPILNQLDSDDRISSIQYRVDARGIKFYNVKEFVENIIIKGVNK